MISTDLCGLGLKTEVLTTCPFPVNLLESAVELYCKVWVEWPWCETDWDEIEVRQFLETLHTRDGAVLTVASIGDRVISLSTGWAIDCPDLLKRTGSKEWAKALSSQKVFYVAELCTDAEYRGYGIGSSLSRMLMAKAQELGFNRFVLRTHVEAAPAQHVYRKLGYVQTGLFDQALPTREYWLL